MARTGAALLPRRRYAATRRAPRPMRFRCGSARAGRVARAPRVAIRRTSRAPRGHLPDDERPGLHLAIELAQPLLLAPLLALLGCRHRSPSSSVPTTIRLGVPVPPASPWMGIG